METTPSAAPVLTVAPGPHIVSGSLTTRRMMIDVLLGLLPLVAVAVWQFRHLALLQIGIGVGAALAAEWLFQRMRGRAATLSDCSAAVTGLILALSLPATAPWYVAAVGSFAAIGLAKVVFGGLGQNLFNPAMVGRAFAMIAFPAAVGASAYVAAQSSIDALTTATPLTALKMAGEVMALQPLFLGTTNGSIGETSALAAILGGLYLCLRRTASWEIPAGAILAVLAAAGLPALFRDGTGWSVAHDLCAGAFLFGAFFIATDPVSSPLTPKGKWIFGAAYGLMVLLIRRLSGYPEGVMFAILIVNALVPLINRISIPVPVGGPVPERK
jgi:electron transport complex protein RnfD